MDLCGTIITTEKTLIMSICTSSFYIYFNATCFFCHTFHDSTTLQYPEVTKPLQREGSVIGSYLVQDEPVERFVP